ncbi:MAG TPA: hypothetical protein VGF08_10065 [Terriglobales bacterium]|jgi:hypothetical protein
MTAAPAPATVQIPPEPMRRAVRIAFGIYMMLLNIVLVYLLFKIWPGKVPADPAEASALVSIFWNKVQISLTPETRYLLIVVLTGALGSYIHAATSFADFIGNRQLYGSWAWWYALRPFIGVALALIVYFSIRGGLVGASTGADGLSPYGVAAIAGLAGLFSKQATDKLREVFENLFKTDHPPNRTDKLTTS